MVEDEKTLTLDGYKVMLNIGILLGERVPFISIALIP